jgi:hypothetical protein
MNFASGDRVIDVVGFSRGAAAALHFSNEVWEKIGKKPPDAPRIRFVGFFDTVAQPGRDPAGSISTSISNCRPISTSVATQ